MYATVGHDYHVYVDGHCYSVPYTLVGEYVECRRSASTVEVYLRTARVALHMRSSKRRGTTTKSDAGICELAVVNAAREILQTEAG